MPLGRRDQQVRQVPLVRRVLQGSQGPLVLTARLGHRDLQDLQDQQVKQDQQEPRDKQDRKDLLVMLEHLEALVKQGCPDLLEPQVRWEAQDSQVLQALKDLQGFQDHKVPQDL